jgi:UPF0716 protein FxsA
MIRMGVAALVLLEIAGFVILGQRLGVLAVLALVLTGAVAGMALLRASGGAALVAVRRALAQGRDPGPAIARGGFRLVAGLLLLLPGFLSDLAALALLLPPVQRGVLRALASGGIARPAAPRPAPRAPSRPGIPPEIPEADWEEVAPPKRPTHRPSGWTRH